MFAGGRLHLSKALAKIQVKSFRRLLSPNGADFTIYPGSVLAMVYRGVGLALNGVRFRAVIGSVSDVGRYGRGSRPVGFIMLVA